MDFSLSEEQELLRTTVRRFAMERLLPNYREWERQERFPRELLPELAVLGLLGMNVGEKYGGQGVSLTTSGVASEELSRGDFNVAYALLLSNLNGDILERHASEELKMEWLPAMTRGEKLVALALTEPGSGSDAAALRLRAERNGDDYVLNGEKTSVSLSTVADAAIVFARTDPSHKSRGISAFLVPLVIPGIERRKFNDLGSKAVARGSIFFDNVRVPNEWMIGAEGHGFREVMEGFDYSRMLLGLMCLGAAQQSLDETMLYVRQREAFGGPISRFQGVSFPIAEAATFLDAARWQCYHALWLRERGRAHTAEAAMCKWWCPKLSAEILHECMLLHGHSGYSDEFPHQQRMRDVMGIEIGDGTAQIMKLVIARQLLGREYVPH